MKIIHKDLNHGEIKLMPENLDDIWHLYNIINIDDLARAVTYRTDDQKDDKIRSKKSEKKRMKLGIRVKEIKFHEFSDRLRIHGIIEEGPQDLGSFHTLNITAENMDKISIIKDEWKYYQLERIDDAVKLSKQSILNFLSLDEDKATFGILRQSGVQLVVEINSNRSGKMYKSVDTEKEYFGDILSTVKTNLKEDTPLIIIGPGFTKENFFNYVKEKDQKLVKNCIVHATNNAGMIGINEAIKTGIIEKITKDNRVSSETRIIERFFEEIKKDGLASYGKKDVEKSLDSGAVEILLINDKILRSKQGEELLDKAKHVNSKFMIINSFHDAGKKLLGIGGIGAILRFKI